MYVLNMYVYACLYKAYVMPDVAQPVRLQSCKTQDQSIGDALQTYVHICYACMHVPESMEAKCGTT